MESYDLIVIGGGSAGMKAARTARRYGVSVALIEERELGGECFWAGCVPTKALIRAAEAWNSLEDVSKYGVDVKIIGKSFQRAMEYKDAVVREVGGDPNSDGGLSKNGIRYIKGTASFQDPHTVTINSEDLHGHHFLLATGTAPFIPPIPGLHEAGYITNREALELNELPRRIAVLGGGPIGLEFGQAYNRFGAEVTIIEHSSDILAHEDRDIARLAHKFLSSEGMHFLTNASVERVTVENNEKVLTLTVNDAEYVLKCDEILVATGRTASVSRLGLEMAGVAMDGRYVDVNSFLQTSQPHIYAAGDISGGFLFTHVASYEGKIAADNIFGDNPIPSRPRVVPRCTYIDPEIASAGMTEVEALDSGIRTGVQTFPFKQSDRAIIYGDTRGLVKLIADLDEDRLIGAHIIGHMASSLIAEAALAIQHDLPPSAIADTMHAYPSFPEAIESAALSSYIEHIPAIEIDYKL